MAGQLSERNVASIAPGCIAVSFLSLHFLLFAILIIGLNWRLRERPGLRKHLLLAGSYYFYMAWDWRFASLLALLTVINFFAGRAIARSNDQQTRRAWLAAALVASLGILAAFKFGNFYVAELQALLVSLGLASDGTLLRIVLPIGISFFTFQSLSYVLDVYRKQEEECTDWRDFALFVAFFPTVFAGPITRARYLLPQFKSMAAPAVDDMEEGLSLVVRGLIKKVVFADVMAAQLVGPAFANPGDFSSLFLLIALYAYTFQIYMDVSGYTDIARGVALLCGFRLPQNFDRPYIASTISNFWQRWHMSMSSFFRDYLYFGLGGTRRGNVYMNLMLTFVAIGVWHGAGWNFLAYGFIHGAVVCVERWLRTRRQSRGVDAEQTSRIGWLLGVVVTFHIVVFSRVLFRAPDFEAAVNYWHHLLFSTSNHTPLALWPLFLLGLAAALHWFLPGAGRYFVQSFTRLPVMAKGMGLLGISYVLMAMSIGNAPFVYFQF